MRLSAEAPSANDVLMGSSDNSLMHVHYITKYYHITIKMKSYNNIISGFCPHWLGVEGPNHHYACFTSTQSYLPSLVAENKTC